MTGEPAARSSVRPQQRALGGGIGQQLRTRREELGLSLRELARRLGVSPSALSQIETGKSRPSVTTLYEIVTELGLSLDEMFAGRAGGRSTESAAAGKPPPEQRTQRRRSATTSDDRVQRSGTRAMIDLEAGVRWERLTARSDPNADFLYVTYGVGASSSPDHFMRHSGREYGLVLSGTLEVTVGFDTYDLAPGDSISFDSTTPHRLRNVGSEPVEGVWVVVGREADDRTRAFDEPDPS